MRFTQSKLGEGGEDHEDDNYGPDEVEQVG